MIPQNGLDSSLKHIDLEGVNKQYEDELRAYEAEVEKSRRLKVVELFLNEKEKRLSTIKEEIGWLSQTGTQSLSRSSSFSADVPSERRTKFVIYEISKPFHSPRDTIDIPGNPPQDSVAFYITSTREKGRRRKGVFGSLE